MLAWTIVLVLLSPALEDRGPAFAVVSAPAGASRADPAPTTAPTAAPTAGPAVGEAPASSSADEGAPATPAAPWMVIVQPGYPGSTREGEGFMARFTRFIGGNAGLPGLAGEYHNDGKKALEAIARNRPGFGIVSLGFFLEQRKSLGLDALLAARPEDTFVLLADPSRKVADLEGKAVAGGPLQELRFLERIAFAGKADVASWKAVPMYASKALREVQRAAAGKGGKDERRARHWAAVVTRRDYDGLKKQKLYTEDLKILAESDPYPPALVVSVSGPGGSLSPDAIDKVKKAFLDFPKSREGRALLEEMGSEGFVTIEGGWLKKLEEMYDADPGKK